MHRKKVIRIIIFAVSLLLVAAGISRKEYLSIKQNADNLCFSCMGLE